MSNVRATNPEKAGVLICVRVCPDVLAKIDALSFASGISRSDFIRAYIKRGLEGVFDVNTK